MQIFGLRRFAVSLRLASFGAILVFGAVVSACSSGNTVLTPATANVSQVAALPAAVATGCIASSTSSETVALPAAGGVSGTITMGSVGTATGCPVSVEVATGSDATLSPGLAAANARLRAAASTNATQLPTPIAQIDLSSQTTSASWLAISLTVPSSVPAGSYPVTITTTVDLGEGSTYTQTSNYTLTVSANGTAALTGINVTFGQFSTGLLQIYPQGTVLPSPSTPSPSPAPSATAMNSAAPSAAPSSSASATPTTAPTATPTAVPTASPTVSATYGPDCASGTAQCGSYVATGSYDGGPESGMGATTTPVPYYGRNVAPIYVPGQYWTGEIVLTVPNYDPGKPQTLSAQGDCPPAVTITQSGPNGDTYTLYFPPDGSQQEFNQTPNSPGCYFYALPPSGTNEPSLAVTLQYGSGNTP